MNDAAIARALTEIQQPKTEKILAGHVISQVDNEPQIARVDCDAADGSVMVYFALENHSYFLAIQVEPLPEPTVRSVSLVAGNECYLISFSTLHPLNTLCEATQLTPTEQWTMEAGGSSSGLTIKTNMPLANSVDNNIEILLTVLEQDAAGIRQLASLATTFIQVHWYAPGNLLPPIRLKAETLQRLAALSVSIDFDLNVSPKNNVVE